MKKRLGFCSCLLLILLTVGCGMEKTPSEPEQTEVTEITIEPEQVTETESDLPEEEVINAPSKEEVLQMRETVLEGMSQEEIDRLTENIKVANLQMESAYLNDNLFEKLEDKESPYWLYFDQKGDIQIGWWYNGMICSKESIMKSEGITEAEFDEGEYELGTVYNRFDANNFITLVNEMSESVYNEVLKADLLHLAELTDKAAQTHEMEYANEIYTILHDMDYFLLRYGIEDVGKYTGDNGTVSKYYGALNVYKQ